MGTLVESDIDQFIRGHKTKLQEEKVHLNQYTDQSRYPGGQDLTSPSGRKQWDRNNAQGARPAEERRAPVEPEETGLLPQNNDIERRKHQLQSERQQEYNDYIAKRGPGGRRRPRTPAEQGLPLGTYENRRKDLAAERQKEMQQALELKRQQILQDEYRREQAEEHRLATEREGLPIGVSDKQKLNQERQREYNEYLAKKGQRADGRRADVLEGKGATLPVGEIDERRRQQLISERQREYNEQQQQKLAAQRQRGLPPKPPTPNHFFKNIGQHDRQQHVLNEERKKEYNQKLAEERGRTAGGRANYGAEQSTGLQFGKADSAEARKLKTRNEEYNEFLQEKKWKDAHRFDNKKPASSRRHSEPSSPRSPPLNIK